MIDCGKFSRCLPFAKLQLPCPGCPHAMSKRSNAMPDQAASPQVKILLVDDKAANLHLLQTILEWPRLQSAQKLDLMPPQYSPPVPVVMPRFSVRTCT